MDDERPAPAGLSSFPPGATATACTGASWRAGFIVQVAVIALINLGSSFGTAIAGRILVSDLASGNTSYVLAMVALAVPALIGLAAAVLTGALLPTFRLTTAGRTSASCRGPRATGAC
jgi:hypothetical protein